MRIRPVAAADRSAWETLWRGYLAFYDTELPARVYDNTFSRLLSDDPADPCGLVAEIDGNLQGLVHFLFHAHCWKPEGICYLQDLFTSPGARGGGIGRALIEAVYDAADARGVPAVYWLTQDFNAPARALYDRIGVCTPFVKYNRPV